MYEMEGRLAALWEVGRFDWYNWGTWWQFLGDFGGRFGLGWAGGLAQSAKDSWPKTKNETWEPGGNESRIFFSSFLPCLQKKQQQQASNVGIMSTCTFK